MGDWRRAGLSSARNGAHRAHERLRCGWSVVEGAKPELFCGFLTAVGVNGSFFARSVKRAQVGAVWSRQSKLSLD